LISVLISGRVRNEFTGATADAAFAPFSILKLRGAAIATLQTVILNERRSRE